MDKKKEQIFKVFDELIEEDTSDGQPLNLYIRYHQPALNMRCVRTFGSLKNALTEYGFSFDKSEELPFEKLFDFVSSCFTVTDDGRIRVDFASFLDKMNELRARGYSVDTTKIINQMEESLELDRLEAFMRYYNETACDLLDSQGKRYPENQIKTIIEKHYTVRRNLYKTYDVNPLMISTASFVKMRHLMDLGNEFEDIAYEVLSEIYADVDRHFVKGNCRPDFVINGEWIDAKLARSTALTPGNITISKYSKQTDHLTIIYALHDTEADDDRATFVNITEYKPFVSAELQRKIDDFIQKASEVKFGASNRLSDGQVRYDTANTGAR